MRPSSRSRITRASGSTSPRRPRSRRPEEAGHAFALASSLSARRQVGDPMFAFLLRRVLQTVPVILAVALLIFVLFSVIPGTFASSLGDDGRSVVDAQVIARMNQEFGLADPLYVRFGRYVLQLATFDLGTSFRTRQPVSAVLAARMWPTVQLCAAAMLFAIAVGVPLGFIAALKPGSLVDSLSMIGAVSGLSLPKFWLGLLL